MMPTDAEAWAALVRTARRGNDEWNATKWAWNGAYYHTETDALTIVRFCLILGVEPTDVLSSRMFGILVERLARLEEVVERLATAGDRS